MADNLAANLAKFNVKDDRIVSFEGKGIKLDNAQTGIPCMKYFTYNKVRIIDLLHCYYSYISQ